MIVPLDVNVLTPEKTILTYRLAGLGTRAIAHILDIIFIFLILFLGSSVAGMLELLGPYQSQIFVAFLIFLMAFLPFSYFVCFEAFWKGQTPGKKLLGIRVRMSDGTPINFQAALTRNILRVADFLPLGYFLGIIAMVVNPKFQRVGDLAANTMVTQEVRQRPSFNIAPHRVGTHPLEHKIGELKHMTDAQYYVLRRYCDRFPELPPDVQIELTDTIWAPLATRLGIELTPDVHPLYLAEATVMKYGRVRGLL